MPKRTFTQDQLNLPDGNEQTKVLEKRKLTQGIVKCQWEAVFEYDNHTYRIDYIVHADGGVELREAVEVKQGEFFAL